MPALDRKRVVADFFNQDPGKYVRLLFFKSFYYLFAFGMLHLAIDFAKSASYTEFFFYINPFHNLSFIL